MTLLDTHIWIWWTLGDEKLGKRAAWLDRQPIDSLGLSIISIWEVAMLVGKGRVTLPFEIRAWVDKALAETRVTVLGLTKDIVIDSRNLPGTFHPDPTDRFIVATARRLDCELLTMDRSLLAFPHVKAIAP